MRGVPSECEPGDAYCIEIPQPLPASGGDADSDAASPMTMGSLQTAPSPSFFATMLDPVREKLREVRHASSTGLAKMTFRPFAREGLFSVPKRDEPEYVEPLAELMEGLNILVHDGVRRALGEVDEHVDRTKYAGGVEVALRITEDGKLRLVFIKSHDHAKHSDLVLKLVEQKARPITSRR